MTTHYACESSLKLKKGKLVAALVLSMILFAACLPRLSYGGGPDSPLNESTYAVSGKYEVLVQTNSLTYVVGETNGVEKSMVVTSIIESPVSIVVKAFLYAGVCDMDISGGPGVAEDPAYLTVSTAIDIYDVGYSNVLIDVAPEWGKWVVYRWDVTEALQEQNVDYLITTLYPTEVLPQFHQLVVVYQNVNLPSRQILINDGNERLEEHGVIAYTHFNLGSSGPFQGYYNGTLIISAMDGTYGNIVPEWDLYENVTFNDELVSDPAGDIWTSLDTEIMNASPVPGTVNTVALSNGMDEINWYLAILVVEPVRWPVITRDHSHFSNEIQMPSTIIEVEAQTIHNVRDSVQLEYGETSLKVSGELDNTIKSGFVILQVDTIAGTVYYNMTIEPHARADFWPMAGKSPSHSGFSLSTVPQTNQTRWNNSAGFAIEYSPAVADDAVFLARNNSITALNETTGAQLWQFARTVTSSPAVANGRVFFGAADGLYALNETTGTPAWRFQTTAPVNSSPIITAGMVIFGCDDHYVYALNETDKSVIWSFLANGPVRTSPSALADPRPTPIVIFGTATIMYAVNMTTGISVWYYPCAVTSSPTSADGLVFFGASDGLYALNATTGAFKWHFSTSASVDSSPAVVDGMVFFGCNDHNIYALNATNKAVIWSDDVGEEVKASPLVAGERTIWGYSWTKGECRDKNTGALMWEFGTSGDIDASPVLAYGHVFFGDMNGNFYCVGPEHDVAVNVVQSSKTVVGQGYTVSIEVQAENVGGNTESFYLSARHGGMIDELPVVLSPGETTTVTFVWNTTNTSRGNYTVEALGDVVPGETLTSDNILGGGWVLVTMPGDVAPDHSIIDIFDIVTVALAFGSAPVDPNWNANADINSDEVVDIFDIVVVALHFGETG